MDPWFQKFGGYMNPWRGGDINLEEGGDMRHHQIFHIEMRLVGNKCLCPKLAEAPSMTRFCAWKVFLEQNNIFATMFNVLQCLSRSRSFDPSSVIQILFSEVIRKGSDLDPFFWRLSEKDLIQILFRRWSERDLDQDPFRITRLESCQACAAAPDCTKSQHRFAAEEKINVAFVYYQGSWSRSRIMI